MVDIYIMGVRRIRDAVETLKELNDARVDWKSRSIEMVHVVHDCDSDLSWETLNWWTEEEREDE